MRETKKLKDWNQTTLPDGTMRLVRRFRDQDWLGLMVALGMGGLLMPVVHFVDTGQHNAPVDPTFLIGSLALLMAGILLCLVRRRWLREEFLVRTNYLERRVIFGRWRRFTRITDGWVFLEEREPVGLANLPRTRYRVRVRGSGGDVVLTNRQRLDWEQGHAPEALVELAEFIAQTTEWPLDIPYLLRAGAGFSRG